MNQASELFGRAGHIWDWQSVLLKRILRISFARAATKFRIIWLVEFLISLQTLGNFIYDFNLKIVRTKSEHAMMIMVSEPSKFTL